MARPKSIPRRVLTEPRYCLAFGLGSGLVPYAPGTAGTLVGLVLFWLISGLDPMIYASFLLLVLLAGVFVCDAVAADLGQKDPGGIVLDEIAGIGVALFMIPAGWYWLIAAFLVFRMFDILKPWPVGWLDRHLNGGWGIMLDDVAAGLYTLAIVQGSNVLMQRLS